MKKTEIKKLRLSRETLFALALPDARKVAGGWEEAPFESYPSSQSNGGACCEMTLPFTRD
jgi:hypothetical protein